MPPSLCFLTPWHIPTIFQTDCSIYNIQIGSRKRKKNKIKNKCCCSYAEGNWGNINLLWNWVCSSVCILQTTLSLRANILFRGTSTSQRHLVEMIHVFLTAVGMNLSCSCLVNHDSSHEWRELPCRYQEVASSLIIIIVFQLMLTISLCMNAKKHNVVLCAVV